MDELHLNLGSLDVIITDRNHPTTIISSEHEEILVLDPRDGGVLREINGHVQARRMLAGRGRVKGSLVLHTFGCLTKVIRLTVLWQVVKCLLPLNPCPGIHHGAWLYGVVTIYSFMTPAFCSDLRGGSVLECPNDVALRMRIPREIRTPAPSLESGVFVCLSLA